MPLQFNATLLVSGLLMLALSRSAPSSHLSVGNPSPADSSADMGKNVFTAYCSTCHKDSLSSFSLAPSKTILATMTPRAVLYSLESGKMRMQAAKLSEQERQAVAQYVTQAKLRETDFPKTAYTPFTWSPQYDQRFDVSGWSGDKEGTGLRRFEQAGISPGNVSQLKLAWAFAFPDGTVTRSRPAVVGDWLITGSQYGDVFAIRRKTGKLGWRFQASAAIRGGITVSRVGGRQLAFFADFSTKTYAIDLATGKPVWIQRAGFESSSTVTGTVAVYNGMVYVPISSLEVSLAANGNYPCCTGSGGAVALDANTGKIIWTHRVVEEKARVSGKTKKGTLFYGPSGAPVWCSPTINARAGLLYIGTGENYSLPTTGTSDAIQALDLKTGKLVWNYQATSSDAYNLACPYLNNCPGKSGPDLDFGMAPILVKRSDGKEILVAGQKSGVVHALDPRNGRLIWKTRIGKGGALGGIHWGMATDGKKVYACNADNQLALDRTDSTVKASPGLFALDLVTGKIVWKTAAPECADKKGCIPANSAAPALAPGIVFAGALDGHLRAYDSEDGKILWDFDCSRAFETVNGIPGKGGSIDGPSPVLADGMLFINSGYGMFGQTSGNVLLAFSIKP